MTDSADLALTPLLANVPTEDWGQVLDLAVREEHPGGELVFRQDDPASDLLVLISGFVKVSVRGRANDVELAELGPGSVLGEMAFLLGGTRSATVRAIGPIALLRFPNAAFQQMLNTRTPAAFQILFNIACSAASRLREADLLVRDLSLQPPASPELLNLRRQLLRNGG
ncbi:MAG: cyclic nucleotide-binding domain-containing protein [Chloroflexi bacterium]|nr:cyclic nucleotide-binding domain-containing protein [Chloroflexota bacterium]